MTYCKKRCRPFSLLIRICTMLERGISCSSTFRPLTALRQWQQKVSEFCFFKSISSCESPMYIRSRRHRHVPFLIHIEYVVWSDQCSKALDRSQVFKRWNQALTKNVDLFVKSHPGELTARIYSSYDTFTRVLDDPESHGFKAEDVCKQGGAIWYDQLHPSSAMHRIIAGDIARLLGDIPAYKENWSSWLF